MTITLKKIKPRFQCFAKDSFGLLLYSRFLSSLCAFLESSVFDLLTRIHLRYITYSAKRLKACLAYCGEGVELDLHAYISDPCKVKIGRGTYIGKYLFMQSYGGVSIGEGCSIAKGVSFITVHHAAVPGSSNSVLGSTTEYKPIVIGDNVWIGSNAILLPGVKIGEGCIVGAGSVVTRNMPPGYVCAGVPCRVIRT